MDEQVPPITVGRFGLEQRCAYRHPDLYDEEVPEIDLESVIARPELGAGCAVRTFLLLGDQNAGKSTLLHSFCRHNDPDFMQLSSLLPVLSSSFINTRLVPKGFLGEVSDPNQPLSGVRDEMPFMDTDIARGVVMLSLENFLFFCNEFGIPGYTVEGHAAGQAASGGAQGCDFREETRFVVMQFVELGGDHLDRLLHFHAAGRDLDAVRRLEGAPAGPEASKDFWSDMHEVLLGSLRLLRDTTRTVYFINCAHLLGGGSLNPSALRAMLRKLRFLDSALGGDQGAAAGPSGEIIFYCSRCSEVDPEKFDAEAAWAATRAEAVAFAQKDLRAAGVAQRLPSTAPSGDWQVSDEGLDLSPLQDVAGSSAHEWRVAETRAAKVLAFIRDALLGLVLPALRARLKVCGVHAVRNLADTGDAGEHADNHGRLCVPSIVRNVARLLQVRLCSEAPTEVDAELLPHVAEVVLRCASERRHVVAPASPGNSAVILGRWVTSADLGAYLEECEAASQAVPLPEIAVLQGWSGAAQALVRAGVCAELAPGASGLPQECLEVVLPTTGHGSNASVLRIRPAACQAGSTASAVEDDVLFVTGSRTPARDARQPPQAVQGIGLPLDADLFLLLSSASTIHSVAAHLRQGAGAGAFRFSAPEALLQLQTVHGRLVVDLDRQVAELVARGAAQDQELPPGTVSQLLHTAADLRQTRALMGLPGDTASPAGEPSAKRPCVAGSVPAGLLPDLAKWLSTATRSSDPEVAVEMADVADLDEKATVRVCLTV